MYRVNSTKDIAQVFKKHLDAGHFTKDRTGSKTIEILGASFVADKPAIFGTPNQAYIDAEIELIKKLHNAGLVDASFCAIKDQKNLELHESLLTPTVESLEILERVYEYKAV